MGYLQLILCNVATRYQKFIEVDIRIISLDLHISAPRLPPPAPKIVRPSF